MHAMQLKLIGYVFVIGLITISVHDIYYLTVKINIRVFCKNFKSFYYVVEWVFKLEP